MLAWDRAQIPAASRFRQDPLGRKSRVGRGCWARGRDGREAPELHVPHESSCVPGGSPASTHREQPWPAAP